MRKSDYQTRFLIPKEITSWDELVESSPQGTLFHHSAWLRSLGTPFRILGCFDRANELVGGIPVFPSSTFGLRISRPPYFVPYSGPVARKIEGKRFNQISVYKKIVECLAQVLAENYQFVRINVHYSTNDIQPFLWKGFLPQIRYTYLVDLENLDTALMEMDVDRRNDIRCGTREGLVCVESEDLSEFVPLLVQSLQAQNIRWTDRQTKQFCDLFWASNATGKGRLFFVRDHKGDLLGGAWLVWDQHRSYYLLVGMDRNSSGRAAVPTLVWHLMRFTRETLGLRWFDFDGADVPQIENFVRAFGGYLTPFFVAIWVSPSIRPLWLAYSLLRAKAKA